MKRKITFGLASGVAAMSAVVFTTVLPSPFALAQPSPALSTEDMVKQANDEVFKARVERNANLFDQRVADDAVFLGFGSGITSKFKAFANDAPADSKVETFRVNNMRVKLEGNTAVVVGRFWVKRTQAGKPTQTSADFMNVFAKRDNRWQLIAAHLENPKP